MSHYPSNFEIVLDLYLISISWLIYKTYWLQITSTTKVCFSGTQSRQTFLLIKLYLFGSNIYAVSLVKFRHANSVLHLTIFITFIALVRS